MTDEIDFLNQDLPNPEQGSVETEAQNPEVENTFITPSWEDVKSGKISYNDLPPHMKTKVRHEAKEETPEDKKYLWDDYGYTPPEAYHGVDKHGRKVQGYDLDGFEDLVKRGKVPKKTKVEQDVEHLTNLVKEQNKTLLTRDERELDQKISELKGAGLSSPEEFDSYEKLLSDKQDIKFQKLQLDKDAPKKEEAKQQTIDQVYSVDEQAAAQVFADNHKIFVDVMRLSPEMTKYFDEQAGYLQKRNPNAPLEQILAATKTITENRFNLNKQQRPMSRNIIQSEQKTNLNSNTVPKLTYNMVDKRGQKWIRSESVSGKSKYSGKSHDDIADMVYGEIYRKMLKK